MAGKDIFASIRMGICCFYGDVGAEPGTAKAHDKLDGLVKDWHQRPTLGGYYVTTNATRTIEAGPDKVPHTYRLVVNLNVCKKHADELFDGAVAGLSDYGLDLRETQEGNGKTATLRS